MNRCQAILALTSATLILVVGCGTSKSATQIAPAGSLAMQQAQLKPVADQPSLAPRTTRRKPIEMLHDGKLVLKLVAVSEPKLGKSTNPMYRSCYDIAKCWAPDGGPYVGKKLTSSYFNAYGESEKLPDKMLHFEVLGDSPQGGTIYALPGKGLDKTTGLVNGYNRTITHGYSRHNESMNQFVLPYFSGGHSAAAITIALTASKYKTIQTIRPPFNIDTKEIDKEFDKRHEAHKSKKYSTYPDKPKVVYPLTHGDWGSVDLNVTVGYTRFSTNSAQVLKSTAPESKSRKHTVNLVFKPAAVPLRQMVKTSIKMKGGKDYDWNNGNHFASSSMVDLGPSLDEIEAIEIATCPFRTYTLPTVSLRPDPAKFANAGSKARRMKIGQPGVAMVDSIGVYTLNSYTDRAAKHYTPHGQYWPSYPGEDSFYNQHDRFPYTIYEVMLDIDKKLLAEGGDFRSDIYSLPEASSPIAALKPLYAMQTYPGFKGRMKLYGEPAKGDRYLQVDMEFANAPWKTVGKTTKDIGRMKELIKKELERLRKAMPSMPFVYWQNEAGEIMLSYYEPGKDRKTVSTGLKIPGKNYQIRLVATSDSGERIYCRPCWLSRNEIVDLSFNMNSDGNPVYTFQDTTLNLSDLKSVELQSRPIQKPKPIILKMPPPVERSKSIAIEVR